MVAVPLLSVAVGASKVHAVPCSTVLLVLLHVITGAVVSSTVPVWLHCAKLPQASAACQVRVASKVVPQCPATLVTVLRIETVAALQVSTATGESNVHAAPCSTVLLPAQVIVGAIRSPTVTV